MDATTPLATTGLEVHSRRFCRNAHCRTKLTESTTDPRRAFCCLGCFRIFYRGRCVVCENSCSVKARTCGRRCRSELRRDPGKYLTKYPSGYYPTLDRRDDARSACAAGTKMPPASDRAWRVIAGPTPPEASLLVPLDFETAARARRANGRAWAAAAKIRPRDWPANLVGGDRRGRPLDPALKQTILNLEVPERRKSPMSTIPTVESLHKVHRKLDRRQQQIDRFVGRMQRDGCALHVYYIFGKPVFALSDGTVVPPAAGHALTKHPNLVAVDPPLIDGTLPQTFRYTPAKRRTDHD